MGGLEPAPETMARARVVPALFRNSVLVEPGGAETARFRLVRVAGKVLEVVASMVTVLLGELGTTTV